MAEYVQNKWYEILKEFIKYFLKRKYIMVWILHALCFIQKLGNPLFSTMSSSQFYLSFHTLFYGINVKCKKLYILIFLNFNYSKAIKKKKVPSKPYLTF